MLKRLIHLLLVQQYVKFCCVWIIRTFSIGHDTNFTSRSGSENFGKKVKAIKYYKCKDKVWERNNNQCHDSKNAKRNACYRQTVQNLPNKAILFWRFNIFNFGIHKTDYSTKYAPHANTYQNHAVIFNGGQK